MERGKRSGRKKRRGRGQVNFRCSDELLRKIDEYIQGEGSIFRSRSDFIRHAVIAYLEGMRMGAVLVASGVSGAVVADGSVEGGGGGAVGIDTSAVDDSFLEEF